MFQRERLQEKEEKKNIVARVSPAGLSRTSVAFVRIKRWDL